VLGSAEEWNYLADNPVRKTRLPRREYKSGVNPYFETVFGGQTSDDYFWKRENPFAHLDGHFPELRFCQ
jgi:hypothetical protein